MTAPAAPARTHRTPGRLIVMPGTAYALTARVIADADYGHLNQPYVTLTETGTS